MVPLAIYDGSDVVLFLDETSQKLRFISGPFSMSNSRHGGKMGIDTASGAQRMKTVVKHDVKPVMPLKCHHATASVRPTNSTPQC